MNKEKIFECIDRRKSIIVHSPGGTGKSYLMREIVVHVVTQQQRNVNIVATTGVAATTLHVPLVEISASTFHRWAGIGLGTGSADQLAKSILSRRMLVDRWRSVEVLIIDEISMFGGSFFDKINDVAQRVRGNTLPFGGIQLVLSGDFLQLPPINDCWIFQSRAWKTLNIIPIVLHSPYRYNDVEYFDMLKRIRVGRHTPEDIDKLYSRVDAYHALVEKIKGDDLAIKPTVLSSTRKVVGDYNLNELEKLDGSTVEFVAKDQLLRKKGNPSLDAYKKLLDDAIPEVIRLKVGAQVMLKANLDTERGLANGSRGVVTRIVPSTKDVYVKFVASDDEELISVNVWTVDDDGARASRTQIPLILAWSHTIHMAQGLTLDYAVCDLGSDVFAPGQFYVAVSRIRGLNSLFLSNFDPSKIIADESAIAYTEQLNKEYSELINRS